MAITIAAALAMTLGAAAPASADAKQTLSWRGHDRAEGAFFDDVDGESFRVCDLRRDNLPVVVRFAYMRRNGTRQTGAHWHTAGVDGRGNGGVRGCSSGHHDFGEGRRVWHQVCIRHGGAAETCTATEVTVA
jgi:hypothetical protein